MHSFRLKGPAGRCLAGVCRVGIAKNVAQRKVRVAADSLVKSSLKWYVARNVQGKFFGQQVLLAVSGRPND